jgi:hypothetical protein
LHEGRRVVLLLACVAVTSALPDAEDGHGEYGETSPAKLNKETPEQISEELSNSEDDTEEFRKLVPSTIFNASGNLYYTELAPRRRSRRRLGKSDPLGTCAGGCTEFEAGEKWEGSEAGVYTVNGVFLGSDASTACPTGCGCQHDEGADAHCHRIEDNPSGHHSKTGSHCDGSKTDHWWCEPKCTKKLASPLIDGNNKHKCTKLTATGDADAHAENCNECAFMHAKLRHVCTEAHSSWHVHVHVQFVSTSSNEVSHLCRGSPFLYLL